MSMKRSGRKRTTGRQSPECTTREVAAAMGVSPQTVVNWANEGGLRCTRTPGGHRRFLRTDVAAFARDTGRAVPSAFFGPSPRKVLIVEPAAELARTMSDFFAMYGKFQVKVVHNFFEFGFTVRDIEPDVVLLNVHLPGGTASDASQFLRAHAKTRHIPIVGCLRAGDLHAEGASPYALVMRWPKPMDEVLSELVNLLRD
jgi:excisionase family DNA binding protein